MQPRPIPDSKQEAFLNSALYSAFGLNDKNDEDLVDLFYGGGTLDAWCPKCRQESVFKISIKLSGYGQQEKKTLPYAGLIEIVASCTRGVDEGNSFSSGCRSPLFVVLFKDYKTVRKIGQHLSAADLVLGGLGKAFDKELAEADRDELGKAIGLQAHGVGIGVYSEGAA